MLRFDRLALRESLEILPTKGRSAFAAAVANRLRGGYEKYSELTGVGNPRELRAALDCLWEYILDDSVPSTELDKHRAILRELAETEESDEIPFTPYNAFAEVAVESAAYALNTPFVDGTDEVIWTAYKAVAAIDQFVLCPVPGEIRFMTRTSDDAGHEHPLIQRELVRQDRDLKELGDTDAAHLSRTIDKLRQRSQQESAVPLDG